MTTLAARLAAADAEIAQLRNDADAYRCTIADAHAVLDAAGLGERGACLHVRMATIGDLVAQLRTENAALHLAREEQRDRAIFQKERADDAEALAAALTRELERERKGEQPWRNER